MSKARPKDYLDRCHCGKLRTPKTVDKDGYHRCPGGYCWPSRAEESLDNKYLVMLDSGAFSAWYHSTPIEVAAYIEYIQEFGKYFNSIVALDVIPGVSTSTARTHAGVQAAAQKGRDNYLTMRKAGIDPIPVFHQGEDWKWLYQMIDDGAKYVGIASHPRATIGTAIRWLDEVFTRITDEEGFPVVKTHGFGETSWRMISRYPWYTCDSTTWALAAGYGTIIVAPLDASGRPDYSKPPYRYALTNRDTAGSRPFLHESPGVQEMLVQEMAKVGLSLVEMRLSDQFRAQFNAAYYMGLQQYLDRFSGEPFTHQVPGVEKLFGQATLRQNFSPRIIFAQQVSNLGYAKALDNVGSKRRLISYYACKVYDHATIAHFTSTGCPPVRERRILKPWGHAYKVERGINAIARLKAHEGANLDKEAPDFLD